MKTPTMKLNGETIKAKKPNVAYWRRLIYFQTEAEFESPIDMIDEMIEIVAGGFGIASSKISHLDLDELKPKYQELNKYVSYLVDSKVEKIPNSETPADE